MAYDFLNQTTYDNDGLSNGDLVNTILQQVYQRQAQEQANTEQGASTNPGEGLHDHEIDPDLADLINSNSEELYSILQGKSDTQDNTEDINPNGFDFTNDQVTPDDNQLYSYLFNGGEGNSSSNNNQDALSGNVPDDLSWLKTKNSEVNLNGLNSKISKYLMSMPDEYKDEEVATSGNDGDEHVEGSQHYQGNAIDLRWNPDVWSYIQNDPLFKSSGLKTINPNHGTAKHIHIQTKQIWW
jgi:hypothetical protein